MSDSIVRAGCKLVLAGIAMVFAVALAAERRFCGFIQPIFQPLAIPYDLSSIHFSHIRRRVQCLSTASDELK